MSEVLGGLLIEFTLPLSCVTLFASSLRRSLRSPHTSQASHNLHQPHNTPPQPSTHSTPFPRTKQLSNTRLLHPKQNKNKDKMTDTPSNEQVGEASVSFFCYLRRGCWNGVWEGKLILLLFLVFWFRFCVAVDWMGMCWMCGCVCMRRCGVVWCGCGDGIGPGCYILCRVGWMDGWMDG